MPTTEHYRFTISAPGGTISVLVPARIVDPLIRAAMQIHYAPDATLCGQTLDRVLRGQVLHAEIVELEAWEPSA